MNPPSLKLRRAGRMNRIAILLRRGYGGQAATVTVKFRQIVKIGLTAGGRRSGKATDIKPQITRITQIRTTATDFRVTATATAENLSRLYGLN